MSMTKEINALMTGPLYRFADWPNAETPNWRAGVYTIWDQGTLLYVGMAGRSIDIGDHEKPEAQVSTRNKGLRDRLNSHASGRRSGDQFCIYVCDRLVLPSLSQHDVAEVAAGQLSLDARTRIYIRERLTYRYVVTASGGEARELEEAVRIGDLGIPRPILNPG